MVATHLYCEHCEWRFRVVTTHAVNTVNDAVNAVNDTVNDVVNAVNTGGDSVLSAKRSIHTPNAVNAGKAVNEGIGWLGQCTKCRNAIPY